MRIPDNVMDLGFKFNYRLYPGPHIDHICCKAFKTLGFIMRLSNDFRQDTSLKMLYCAFVHPILKYSSVVWNPYTACDSMKLERVQRKFLRFASFQLGIPCEPHDYSPVSKVLNLPSLAVRRR